jgi:hypothetical protein
MDSGAMSREPSPIENICSCYADGLVAGLTDSRRAHPWNIEFQGVPEFEQTYALGIKDGRTMRERMREVGVYQ